MELELGLKFSKDADDFTSTDHLRIAKDRAGIVFVSKETDAMFNLTANLTGYKRDQIKIEINQKGTRIIVSGEKPVQETVIVGWKVYKKGIEMRGFKKTFKIPDGVILDEINANFNQQDSVLTVSMPKSVKGIRGSTTIQEVDEEEEEEECGIVEEAIDSIVSNPEEIATSENAENVIEEKDAKQPDPPKEKQELDEIKHTDQEAKKKETRNTSETGNEGDSVEEKHLDDEASRAEQVGEAPGSQPPERSSIFCAPIIAGSALIVSIIVFVFHFIRTKDPPKSRKN